MSYVRMNYFEYISEEAADELEAHYIKNAPKNFPDATALVFLRTGPTTASLTSIYPNKDTFEKSAAQRKKGIAGVADKIKNVRLEEGEASLALMR
jgi:hypothetical protein|tara:strand:+ start:276 stop:560 length:285 start_codon:yes stop_codon:yes gene_type:complete